MALCQDCAGEPQLCLSREDARCDYCQQPLADTTNVVCPQCSQAMKLCELCGGSFQDEWNSLIAGEPRCRACQAVLLANGECPICHGPII